MEIKLSNVCFSYKKVNYKEKEILKDININFDEGKISAIIGKSGSGKTTLIELIDSLLVPTKGEIIVGNECNSNVKKNIGIVFQFPEEQFFNQTVRQELEIVLKLNDYRLKEKDKRIVESLVMVGLDETYLKLNPFTLSNGEKRKLALAQALILNPKVLLLDEPTIGLDSKSKNDVIKLLRILKNRYNKTIIIATHDINFIHKIVDYIYVLDNKKIILEGDKYTIFKQEKLLNKIGIKVPNTMAFSNKVLETKKIKIGYRDDINDLIKDIYRYVK